MAVVLVVLGVVLLVLAAYMTAAQAVLLTRANHGVPRPLWEKPSEPAAITERPEDLLRRGILLGLATGLAVGGAESLNAASPDHILRWWGLALAGAVMGLPPILVRESFRLHRRLRSHRERVQHGH